MARRRRGPMDDSNALVIILSMRSRLSTRNNNIIDRCHVFIAFIHLYNTLYKNKASVFKTQSTMVKFSLYQKSHFILKFLTSTNTTCLLHLLLHKSINPFLALLYTTNLKPSISVLIPVSILFLVEQASILISQLVISSIHYMFLAN